MEQKKFRHTDRLFIAEGPKTIGELLAVSPPKTIIATSQWLCENNVPGSTEVIEVGQEELQKVSLQKMPQQVLGIFPFFTEKTAEEICQLAEKELCLVLDGIQDPGNLGTIIRIADWFGIRHIICSCDSVDVYNPKTIQATMGSLARVNLTYTDLATIIGSLPRHIPVYGTVLDGDNMYEIPLSKQGLIVMGNEGNGISKEIQTQLTHRILIPNYPSQSETAESLNVAIATAIVCAEFRRPTC